MNCYNKQGNYSHKYLLRPKWKWIILVIRFSNYAYYIILILMLEMLLHLYYFSKSCGSFENIKNVHMLVSFRSFLEQSHNCILSHPHSYVSFHSHRSHREEIGIDIFLFQM